MDCCHDEAKFTRVYDSLVGMIHPLRMTMAGLTYGGSQSDGTCQSMIEFFDEESTVAAGQVNTARLETPKEATIVEGSEVDDITASNLKANETAASTQGASAGALATTSEASSRYAAATAPESESSPKETSAEPHDMTTQEPESSPQEASAVVGSNIDASPKADLEEVVDMELSDDDIETAPALKTKDSGTGTEDTQSGGDSTATAASTKKVAACKLDCMNLMGVVLFMILVIVPTYVIATEFSKSLGGSLTNLAGIPLPTKSPSVFPSSEPPSRYPTDNPSFVPSSSPSASPSYNAAPSMNPTRIPVVTKDFQVRLYWQQGFYWQELYDEEWWCMECVQCANYTLNDGHTQNCTSPGDTEKSCEEGQMIWVDKCGKKNHRFECVENYNTGMQVRVHNTDLCFSIAHDLYLELRPCDARNSTQLFQHVTNRTQFYLWPWDQRDLGIRQATCLTQRHHPKPEEVVGLHNCRMARGDETLYWEEWYDPVFGKK